MAELRFSRLPVDGLITGRFGESYGTYLHRGVDFGVAIGTPVFAPADGLVVTFTNDGSFGTGVCLYHESTGWYTLYAHLSSKIVSVGQQVREGDCLGHSGNTGTSSGPHLHWQLCKYSTFPVDITQSADPLLYYHPEDEPMTPAEREEFEKIKRVLCEWGQPGNLAILDSGGVNIRQQLLNLNDAVNQLINTARAQGWPV